MIFFLCTSKNIIETYTTYSSSYLSTFLYIYCLSLSLWLPFSFLFFYLLSSCTFYHCGYFKVKNCIKFKVT
ncbi:hypothetical protein Lalb_Chr06g0175901 [Lupinus albus]|uniref:Uncharacterized protein n=1 Tax=Lupinus albus TaxID=3870 RepID=A0A6A4QEH5_LUPAL|nr:hypothetical protein Lalb_Chr06g0175901 [Lupinus albus]